MSRSTPLLRPRVEATKTDAGKQAGEAQGITATPAVHPKRASLASPQYVRARVRAVPQTLGSNMMQNTPSITMQTPLFATNPLATSSTAIPQPAQWQQAPAFNMSSLGGLQQLGFSNPQLQANPQLQVNPQLQATPQLQAGTFGQQFAPTAQNSQFFPFTPTPTPHNLYNPLTSPQHNLYNTLTSPQQNRNNPLSSSRQHFFSMPQQNPYNILPLPRQNLYNNLTSPQQNPYNALTASQQNPYNAMTSSQQNAYSTMTASQQNPYNTMTASQQNPYPNLTSVQQSPYNALTSSQQNLFSTMTSPLQNMNLSNTMDLRSMLNEPGTAQVPNTPISGPQPPVGTVSTQNINTGTSVGSGV